MINNLSELFLFVTPYSLEVGARCLNFFVIRAWINKLIKWGSDKVSLLGAIFAVSSQL